MPMLCVSLALSLSHVLEQAIKNVTLHGNVEAAAAVGVTGKSKRAQ